MTSTEATIRKTLAQNKTPLSDHFEDWLIALEQTRRVLAKAFDGYPDNFAFTSNTSQALSTIAHTIDWKPGDRIAYLSDDFSSNRFIWQSLSERYGTHPCPIKREPYEAIEPLFESLDPIGLRAIAIPFVHYRDGITTDVLRLVKWAHQHNILVIVDAIQGLGIVPASFRNWDADFVACGGQKWLLSPVGTGFLYVHPSHLEELMPASVGWASHENPVDFTQQSLRFAAGARRYEGGLPPVPLIAGLANSVDHLDQIGIPTLFKHVQQLQTRLIASLPEPYRHEQLRLSGSGIVTLPVTPQQSEKLKATFAHEGVITTLRDGLLRVALHGCSNNADVDKLTGLLGRQTRTPSRSKHNSESPTLPPDQTRWAIINGPTQGLGRAFCTTLAERGFSLLLVGRSAARLCQEQATLQEQHPSLSIDYLEVDYQRPETVHARLSTLCQERTISFIVNAAATAETGLVEATELSTYQHALNVNFLTPLAIIQSALRDRKRSSPLKIVNLLTSGARCGFPLFGTYASSKSPLWTLGESIALEYDPSVVTVTTAVPPKMTSMTSNLLARQAVAYYDFDRDSRSEQPLHTVVEKILQAADKGQSVVMPRATFWQHLVNLISPHWLQKRIRRQWKFPLQ